jgi:hypothetical protein
MSGRYIHIFAVFSHGASGELDALRLECRRKLVVGQGMTCVFVLNELANLSLENQ